MTNVESFPKLQRPQPPRLTTVIVGLNPNLKEEWAWAVTMLHRFNKSHKFPAETECYRTVKGRQKERPFMPLLKCLLGDPDGPEDQKPIGVMVRTKKDGSIAISTKFTDLSSCEAAEQRRAEFKKAGSFKSFCDDMTPRTPARRNRDRFSPLRNVCTVEVR